jgi:hypothetical protein
VSARSWLGCLLAGFLVAVPIAAQRNALPSDDLRGRASEARFESGHYSQAGISFDVPADWNYGGTIAAGAPSDETAHWIDPRPDTTFYAWFSKRKASAKNISTLLAAAIPNKTSQRAGEGYQRWQVRPESVQRTSLGGHQALVAIADFDSRAGGRPRVEYLTWIFAVESRILFFATMSPEQFAQFQPEFDRIVRSARLP